ncbi:MAG: GAF domain-containing protein, partial [Gaiellaceae bacterium]
MWFNAVPLLVVAAAYLGAAAVLTQAFRGRPPRTRLEPGILAVFPAIGLAAAVYGIVLAVERQVPPGGIWLTLGLAVGVCLPALLALRVARRPEDTPEQELGPAVSGALTRSDDLGAIATTSLAEALDRERFVARISARVRSELDIDELLRVAVEETGRALAVNRCLIRLGPHGDIPTAQWQESGLEPVTAGRRLAVSNLAVKRRETVAIENVETAPELDDASLGGRDMLMSLGSRAVLAVPIVIFDELIGVLGLHRNAPGRWSEEEIALTEAVAREIGLAVRVAQLLRENEQRMDQQGALFRIAAQLSESLSLSDTLEGLAQAANDALGGAFSAVLMPRGGTLELTAATGLPPVLAAALEDKLPASADCLRAAAREGRPLASPDITRDDRFEQPWREQAEVAGYRALLAVPAASPRAEDAGLVVVFFTEEHEFTDDDLELARHLGDAARGALERSELFE